MDGNKPRASVTSGAHWGFFVAEVEDGRVVAAHGLKENPDPAALIAAMPSAVYDRTRVMHPMVRKGWLDGRGGKTGAGRGAEPFVRVGWDEAIGLVAGEIARVRDSYGPQAILAGSYGWASAGRLHNAGALLRRMMGLAGGYTNQVGNYSSGAGDAIVPFVMGSAQAVGGAVPAWETIAEHTDLIVAFGGMPLKNTQVHWGGLGQHMTRSWLTDARKAGVNFVCISPIREDLLAEVEAEWWPARPTTDVPIMLALAHTLVSEELCDTDFIQRCTAGFEKFRPYLMGETDGVAKDAEWAGRIAEIAPERIRELARRMASCRTLITATWSVQRAQHGEQPYWMAIVLASLLGQIGLPGGGVGFGYGSAGARGRSARRIPIAGVPPVSNPAKSYIPVSRITETLLEPGRTIDFNGKKITYPEIQLIYWAGGNPYHHHQDLNRLRRGWARPETVIVNENFWTATARHADIVLPATTGLERNDIGAGSEEKFFVAMQKAIEPVGESRNDYDIFAEVAARLGVRDAFTEGRDEMGWLRHIYDVSRQQAAEQGIEMPDFDGFWRQGTIEFPGPEKAFVPFASFRRDPEGKPLKTPSGRIEIFSDTIAGFGYDDCPGHPTWMEPAEWLGAPAAAQHPLQLMSNQPRTRLHSQLDSADLSRASKIKGREPVWIHPQDAAARGIVDGDIVRVFNGRGACINGAVVTDAVRPGVIKIETGAWFDPADPSADGSDDKHGNPNVLTLDKGTSRLAQAPSANTCLVQLARYEGEPPPVTAFEPPAEAAR